MPKGYDITCIINLEENNIKDWFVDQENALRSFVEPKISSNLCPRCGKSSIILADSIPRRVRDVNVCGRKSYLEFDHTQLECTSCFKKWMIPLDFVLPNSRYTIRFEHAVYELCRIASAKHAGEHYELSDKTAQRIYQQVSKRRRKTKQDMRSMEHMGIDEIAMRKGHKNFIIIISDITNKKVVEVLENRTKACVENYLLGLSEKERASIKSVSMDLWGPYRSAVKAILPHARIVADRFHVQQNLNKLLDICRRSVKKTLNPDDKNFWSHAKYALLKNQEDLTDDQQKSLNRILPETEVLNSCYKLKESLRIIFKTKTNIDDARNEIYKWMVGVYISEKARSFHCFIKTFLNWESEILNYFIASETSGFVEGINNKIKLLKRIGFGFVNFENFRNKILDCCS